MQLSFYKYQGNGNDFVIIDDRENILVGCTGNLARRLCHRRWGIGADGLVVIQAHTAYDFAMTYHNADGSQSLCGNGSRCAVYLAQQLGIIDRKAHFLTTDGPHRAHIKGHLVYLQLHNVSSIQFLHNGYLLDTGSPHYVQWVEDCINLDVFTKGREIRNSPPFQKNGVNVNFVQLRKDNSLYVRTYERGVEDETLSCGTGAVAAALAATTRGYMSPVTVSSPGGVLRVSFKHGVVGGFQDVCLVGPARLVFQGLIDLD